MSAFLTPSSGGAHLIHPITEEMFGAIQTGFHGFKDFEEQSNVLGVTHIRWPGGTISELRQDIYDLNLPELYDATHLYAEDATRIRPGLSEMLKYTVSEGKSFSMIVPTFRYTDQIDRGVDDLSNFLTRLLAGHYGSLPNDLTIEIGNEYCTSQNFSQHPEEYGRVASTLVEAASQVISDSTLNPDDVSIKIAVQMGYSSQDDMAIRGAFTPEALSSIDSLVVHALPINLRNLNAPIDGGTNGDEQLSLVERTDFYFKAWTEAISAAGGRPDPELYLSAWTVGAPAHDSSEVLLEYQDYGLPGASVALELFSGFASIGADKAAFWGLDVDNLNHFINDEGDLVQISPTGAMFSMLRESIVGLSPMQSFQPHSREDSLIIHSFGGNNKIVIYASANSVPDNGLTTRIDLSALTDPRLESVRTLTAELPPEHNGFKGSAEQELFEVGVISKSSAEMHDGVVELRILQPYAVYELTFQTSEDFPLAGISIRTDIEGTTEDDKIQGTDNEDRIIGLNGDDVINGKDGDDSIIAGAGNDDVNSGRGNDFVAGWAGNDTILGHDGDDLLYGNKGDDVISGDAGNDKISGGIGDDTLVGGSGDDIVVGDAGNDIIEGWRGNDDLDGCTGDDRIFGNEGEDRLQGGDGDDWIEGGDDDDNLLGGRGDDFLAGQHGDDRLEGWSGNDIIDAGDGDDVIYGGAGEDRLFGGNGADRVLGDGGDDFIVGGPGSDILDGGTENDVLEGWGGNDWLFGGGGADHLFGNSGDDWLDGGYGDDLLIGGDGSDSFILAPGCGRDRILDYDSGADRILLSTNLLEDGETMDQFLDRTATFNEYGTTINLDSENGLLVEGVGIDGISVEALDLLEESLDA